MLGRFAVSMAGHDKGTEYVVLAEQGTQFILTDGKFHPLSKPKKKNKKHIQLLDAYLSEELLQRLQQNETIYDHEIKYEIRNRRGVNNV